MFENIAAAPPDAILGISEAFNKDPNPNKVNLSVGVFKDEAGKTPIPNAVKEAEKRLLDREAVAERRDRAPIHAVTVDSPNELMARAAAQGDLGKGGNPAMRPHSRSWSGLPAGRGI